MMDAIPSMLSMLLYIVLTLLVLGGAAFWFMIVVLVAYAWGWDRVLYGLGWQLNTFQRPERQNHE